LRRPGIYRLAARLGRLAQRPIVSGGMIRRLPLFFGEWTRTRDLPPVAAHTFQERWRDLEREGRR
jgi:L-lactate dehydrogenase complex protein LldF